jgi:CRISPR-associated protein Cas2
VEDKRRNKVAKLLLGYGARVQYSVFECDLDAPQLTAVLLELHKLIDTATDSVRCYPLEIGSVQRIQIIGLGHIVTDPGFYVC